MTKLTELDRDKVLPKERDTDSHCIDWKAGIYEGFNYCVFINDRLELVVDEEVMERIICKVQEDNSTKGFGQRLNAYQMDREIAKHLKSTLGQWCKIGIRK